MESVTHRNHDNWIVLCDVPLTITKGDWITLVCVVFDIGFKGTKYILISFCATPVCDMTSVEIKGR